MSDNGDRRYVEMLEAKLSESQDISYQLATAFAFYRRSLGASVFPIQRGMIWLEAALRYEQSLMAPNEDILAIDWKGTIEARYPGRG